MTTCKNCQHSWSWWQTFKKTFTVRIGVHCPYCNEKQYFSARYRVRSTVIPVALSPLIMITGIYLGLSYISLIIAFSLFVLFLMINPLFVELSNEEEPLF